jgi:hypothetical protein
MLKYLIEGKLPIINRVQNDFWEGGLIYRVLQDTLYY